MYVALASFRKFVWQDAHWGILICIAIGMAVMGPFGSFQTMNFPMRLLYWGPTILMVPFAVGCADAFAGKLMQAPFKLGKPAWIRFLFVVIYSFAIWLYGALFDNHFLSVVQLAYIAAIVAVAVLLTNTTLQKLSPASAPQRPRLMSRLPKDEKGAVVRLTVDDHYVEVHMEDGTVHRLLMRLSDAVNEMDCVPGFCTHRSHWVAVAFVAEGMRDKSRERLKMTTGDFVPVSKTYRVNAVEAGFL